MLFGKPQQAERPGEILTQQMVSRHNYRDKENNMKGKRVYLMHGDEILINQAAAVWDKNREEIVITKLINAEERETLMTVCYADGKPFVQYECETEDEAKCQIEDELLKIWKLIGIEIPENMDDIIDYVYDDIMEASDPEYWHSGDVAIALRRYLESKSKATESG